MSLSLSSSIMCIKILFIVVISSCSCESAHPVLTCHALIHFFASAHLIDGARGFVFSGRPSICGACVSADLPRQKHSICLVNYPSFWSYCRFDYFFWVENLWNCWTKFLQASCPALCSALLKYRWAPKITWWMGHHLKLLLGLFILYRVSFQMQLVVFQEGC